MKKDHTVRTARQTGGTSKCAAATAAAAASESWSWNQIPCERRLERLSQKTRNHSRISKRKTRKNTTLVNNDQRKNEKSQSRLQLQDITYSIYTAPHHRPDRYVINLAWRSNTLETLNIWKTIYRQCLSHSFEKWAHKFNCGYMASSLTTANHGIYRQSQGHKKLHNMHWRHHWNKVPGIWVGLISRKTFVGVSYFNNRQNKATFAKVWLYTDLIVKKPCCTVNKYTSTQRIFR